MVYPTKPSKCSIPISHRARAWLAIILNDMRRWQSHPLRCLHCPVLIHRHLLPLPVCCVTARVRSRCPSSYYFIPAVLRDRSFHVYGKRFLYSILCFGFCMARCAALAVRIAITQHQTDKTLNIIGQVLIAAGVLLLVCIYAIVYVHTVDPSLVYCPSSNEPPLLRTTASSSFSRHETFRTCSLLAYTLYPSYE